MKQTFLEKFGQIYAYPYGSGTSFTEKATKALVDDQEGQPDEMLEHEHLFGNMYERVLLGKRTMAPFHLNCTVTNKQICRCAYANLPKEELEKHLNRNTQDRNPSKRPRTQGILSESVAYDMHLYFEGYPAGLQEHLYRKLQHERKRLMHVSNHAHAASFSRFIDSEDETLEQDISLAGGAGQTAVLGSGVRSQQCTHCKAQIFESGSGQSWKNERGTLVTLCAKCNQKYIAGLVDNSSEHRKFSKYIQQLCGKLQPMDSQKPDIVPIRPPKPAPVISTGSQILVSQQQPSRPVPIDSTPIRKSAITLQQPINVLDPKKCQVCQKRVANVTETNDSLQCTKCDKLVHGKCMNLHSTLVKRFVWHCLLCRTCKECEEPADGTQKYFQCQMCDQSVHEACMTTAMKSNLMEQTGKLACEECIKCNFCKDELPLVTTIIEGQWLENTERLCQKCHSTYAKEGDECGRCKQSYDGDFVMCDICESWHCIPCSEFTQDQIDNIEDQSYICKKCANKQK